jgi:hypothetical protein
VRLSGQQRLRCPYVKRFRPALSPVKAMMYPPHADKLDLDVLAVRALESLAAP